MTYALQTGSKTAALVIIGNEILSGRTPDTNTPWIAESLLKKGILVCEVRIVADEEDAIVRAVLELKAQVDYLFTTGGIGPTHDDITAQSIARAFGVPLLQDPCAFALLEAYYGLENITPSRARMARIPQGARLIPNTISAAPGFIIGNVHVLAGVPRIMQSMMDHVLETLEGGTPIVSSTVTCALTESVLAEGMESVQGAYPDVQIGSYPHYRAGVAGLSIVLRGKDRDRLDYATEELASHIRSQGDEPQVIRLRMTEDE